MTEQARQHAISCVIISNSDDLHFVYDTLTNTAHIFQEIVISIGSKLWNGDPEDHARIAAFKDDCTPYTNVKVVMYAIPEDKIAAMQHQVSAAMYWEAHARWVAYNAFERTPGYILFLDSDEVIDGALFKTWLDSREHLKYDVLKLKNYWYWREKCYRARGYLEDSVVLIKNGAFNAIHFFSNMGRHALYDGCYGEKKGRNMGGETPFIHHYSWVRTKEGMLRKVKSWGHRNDRTDWVAMVEEEFSRPFNGTDFVKKLHYDVV
jgi:hypothetical protein